MVLLHEGGILAVIRIDLGAVGVDEHGLEAL